MARAGIMVPQAVRSVQGPTGRPAGVSATDVTEGCEAPRRTLRALGSAGPGPVQRTGRRSGCAVASACADLRQRRCTLIHC